MTTIDLADNPFKVLTPEDMDAEDVTALFVDPFTDFVKIRSPGNTMLNGPRGCGKSMIFRYLLSDCQTIVAGKQLLELPFLAFLISIKNTGPTPNLTDFQRLQGRHAELVLNEHVLTTFVAAKVFAALRRFIVPSDDASCREATDYFDHDFRHRLALCGFQTPALDTLHTPSAVFGRMADTCEDLYNSVIQYVKRLAWREPTTYEGALCGYLDFLVPLLTRLKHLSFLPAVPYYLLLDDADYLNMSQTIILNSWVSTRTQADVCIKISTQHRYKTLSTVSGLPIQSPHDFQAVEVADIYTTNRSSYRKRMHEIVARRLTTAGIDRAPHDFFPVDTQQEAAIDAIAQQIRSEWTDKRRGYRPHDDSIRYARPEYIRSLGGTAKSTSTYSYAGFNQLVHISSGLVRYFLESAATMFDEQRSTDTTWPIRQIKPSIQNKVARDRADHLMFTEFEDITSEMEATAAHDLSDTPATDIHQHMNHLRNLIKFLGGLFYLKLVSDDSERRVFSVAVSGPTDGEVLRAFDLGVQYGYFHRASIGNKEGTGRARLYVLTRRLAPFYKLDPSSFAGYLWLPSTVLREALTRPATLLNRYEAKGSATEFQADQLLLFGEQE